MFSFDEKSDRIVSNFVETFDFAVSMREVALSLISVYFAVQSDFISLTRDEKFVLRDVSFADASEFHCCIVDVIVYFMCDHPVAT